MQLCVDCTLLALVIVYRDSVFCNVHAKPLFSAVATLVLWHRDGLLEETTKLQTQKVLLFSVAHNVGGSSGHSIPVCSKLCPSFSALFLCCDCCLLPTNGSGTPLSILCCPDFLLLLLTLPAGGLVGMNRLVMLCFWWWCVVPEKTLILFCLQ